MAILRLSLFYKDYKCGQLHSLTTKHNNNPAKHKIVIVSCSCGLVSHGRRVTSCMPLFFFFGNADSTAIVAFRMTKRHKWQPAEPHRKDQISHQPLSAHQRGGMLTAPLQGPDKRGRTNSIHHVSGLSTARPSSRFPRWRVTAPRCRC